MTQTLISQIWKEYQDTGDKRLLADAVRYADFGNNPQIQKEIVTMLLKSAGKRVIESAHCPSGNAFFGVFRHLYIGMFGGMDLVIDPYSSARNGVIEITVSQLTDVAVAHAGAFNKVTLTA